MKKIILCYLLITLLFSCKEDFKIIDPSQFNQSIANRTDINSAKQLVKVYYNYPNKEGEPNLFISEEKLENGNIRVTLIHDAQEDDSQRATKIILTTRFTNNQWYVLDIKRNHKCWDGRGHTDWGTEWCN